MRMVLESLGEPHHVGLAYDAWAPVVVDGRPESLGKVLDDRRGEWLGKLAGLSIDRDYPHFYGRWKASFGEPDAHTFELALASRLLVGHGNSSGTDVGITVHHTWGVPVIPGSALKGLLAHYLDAVHGPGQEGDPAREQCAGGQGSRGPGEVYRVLFGAPEAGGKSAPARASAGMIQFHDAIYVPHSVPEDRPFAADVLTVHQKSYYDSTGQSWPNDYDDPIPVAFLTIRPCVRLLFALSGPADWRKLAERLLRNALEQWGVGGKTSAGYGRLVDPSRLESPKEGKAPLGAPPPASLPRPGDVVQVVLLEARTTKGGWKARHEASGCAGPINNSPDVPVDKKAGDRIELVVASVNPSKREMYFRFTQEPPRSPSPRAGNSKGR